MGCMTVKEGDPSPDVCPICDWQEGSPALSPEQLLPRTMLEKHYLLGAALGQGGFGITYLARDLRKMQGGPEKDDGQKEHEKGAILAIKEFYPRSIATRVPGGRTVIPTQGNLELFDVGLSRFINEAEALRLFKDHEGVVRLYEWFKDNGTAYIVMEFVEGSDLKKYLKKQAGGRIPFNTAYNIFMRVMDALREVHAANILHRDVSPDNIFINAHQVKIGDFGSARYHSIDYSQSLQLTHKVGYTPEEQYRTDEEQGPWTDVYSLAASFYHAITGVLPQGALERLHQERLGNSSLTPPSQLGIPIPPKAEAVLCKALAVHSGGRYDSIAKFQQAMMCAVEGGVPVPREPLGRLVSLFLQSRRPAIGVIVALIAAAIGIAVLSTRARSLRPQAAPPVQLAGGRGHSAPPSEVAVSVPAANGPSAPSPSPPSAIKSTVSKVVTDKERVGGSAASVVPQPAPVAPLPPSFSPPSLPDRCKKHLNDGFPASGNFRGTKDECQVADIVPQPTAYRGSVDLYHFQVSEKQLVTIKADSSKDERFQFRPMLLLLDGNGNLREGQSISQTIAQLSRNLDPGGYYVLVTAKAPTAGHYELDLSKGN
jgi:serine/threonine protein kinase